MNIQLDDIRDDIRRMVAIALEEDIGSGDITAQLIPEDKVSTATVITREDCVLCGQAWFDEVFHQLGGIDEITWDYSDGDWVKAGSTLVTLTGNARNLLTGERTALNFLQTLSGTATASREYANLVQDTSTRVLDTRKTIPGLRTAQKYAVVCGGCDNHRIGLYDAFLIKENHIWACGGIWEAVAKAREIAPEKPIEIEVENLDELYTALAAGADRIMLDNFSASDTREAIVINNSQAQLEISGNITAESVVHSLQAGLDFVSIGSLTKHCKAADLSFRLIHR